MPREQPPAPQFDAPTAIAAVKELRKEQRHRITWGKSRLQKFRAELVAMRAGGASLGVMVVWLASAKRTRVHRSTVKRFLDTLDAMEKAGRTVDGKKKRGYGFAKDS